MNDNISNTDKTFIESNVKQRDRLLEGNEGIRLGSGVLKQFIGKGGMAEVYKIWNSGLQTFRAVKIANRGAGDQFYRRFISEARIVERLKHRNIIVIKEIGEWNNLPFIEMEYINGSTLKALLEQKGSLLVKTACAIAAKILNALKYAHAETVYIEDKSFKGIFHRDLKPENIMVSSNGRIVVMDFGLARPITQGINSTCIGTFVGTLDYAAPEQFEMGMIDHRADLFALGVILYEMVTGRNPFYEITNRCTTPEEYVAERKSITWRMIDTSAIKSHRIVNIIKRCLEKSPDKRYQSASEVLDDLKAVDADAADADDDFIAKTLFGPDERNLPLTKPPNLDKIKMNTLPIMFGAAGICTIATLIAIFLLTGPRETVIKPAEGARTDSLMHAPSDRRKAHALNNQRTAAQSGPAVKPRSEKANPPTPIPDKLAARSETAAKTGKEKRLDGSSGGKVEKEKNSTIKLKPVLSSTTDIDGNTYPTVVIGKQVWTTVNLRVTKYNDGTAIPNVTDPPTWAELKTGAYCFYDNSTDPAEQAKWGALYNWHAVGSGQLAPEGWRVPSDDDWTELENYLVTNGFNYDGTITNNKIAKSMAASTDWQAVEGKWAPGNNLSMNNWSGFSALPGGCRNWGGNFIARHSIGNWWSATAYDSSIACFRSLIFNSYSLDRLHNDMQFGFSVRFVRDLH